MEVEGAAGDGYFFEGLEGERFGEGLVVGADFLADVAAEDDVADGFVELLGDFFFVFDGEVGNTAAGV